MEDCDSQSLGYYHFVPWWELQAVPGLYHLVLCDLKNAGQPSAPKGCVATVPSYYVGPRVK